VNIFVTAEGRVPKCAGLESADIKADYVMKLSPGRPIGGTVVDDQDQPVAGVKIQFSRNGSELSHSESIDFQTLNVKTGDDGTWHCQVVPPEYDRISLDLVKKGYAGTQVEVPLVGVNCEKLVLVIDRGYVLSGCVTDDQQHPVMDATVKTVGMNRASRKSARTDSEGRFSLIGVRGDSQMQRPSKLVTNAASVVRISGVTHIGIPTACISVEAASYAPQKRTITLNERTNQADFVMSPGCDFHGRIVNEAGNPVTNAVIQTDFDFENQEAKQYEWLGHSDAEGRFQWISAPKEPICYWISAPGYGTVRGKRLEAGGDNLIITLKHVTD
jgi:hypothetical protein